MTCFYTIAVAERFHDVEETEMPKSERMKLRFRDGIWTIEQMSLMTRNKMYI